MKKIKYYAIFIICMILCLSLITGCKNTKKSAEVDNKQKITDNKDAEAFSMPIKDVFNITGRGTVVCGTIESGSIKVGDPVEIIGEDIRKKSCVIGIERNRELVDEAKSGEWTGVLLENISVDEAKEADFITDPTEE
jgi:translation elongation factor EF-Tu-like GTPase